jgi:protein-tyrosine phosphatase
MIDTHCHLLPGVDDGPRTLAEALDLARELVACGVEAVVCTPHYSRQFPVGRAEATAAHEALRTALDSEEIPLETVLGAELSPAFAVMAPVEELTARALADRYIVVEVLPDTPAPFFATVGDRLADSGLRTVFAHPELSRTLARRFKLLDEQRSRGALVQVLAPGVTGRRGRRVATTAWKLLESGRVDLLASDAHGRSRPAWQLVEAAELVERRLGRQERERLTEREPRRLVPALVHGSE